MQNVVVGQDTTSTGTGSTLIGVVQLVPLNVTTSPLSPTAVQDDAVGHDTDVNELLWSIVVGAVQLVPLNLTALPLLSTATDTTKPRNGPLSTGPPT